MNIVALGFLEIAQESYSISQACLLLAVTTPTQFLKFSHL